MKTNVSFNVFRKYHRAPKGAKFAKSNGLRNVPPTSWDDIPHDKNKTQLCSYIRRMYAKGIEEYEAARKLRDKGFTGHQADWLIRAYYW